MPLSWRKRGITWLKTCCHTLLRSHSFISSICTQGISLCCRKYREKLCIALRWPDRMGLRWPVYNVTWGKTGYLSIPNRHPYISHIWRARIQMHGGITSEESNSSRLYRHVRQGNNVRLPVATMLIINSARKIMIRQLIIMLRVIRPSRRYPSNSSIPRDSTSLSCTLKLFWSQ